MVSLLAVVTAISLLYLNQAVNSFTTTFTTSPVSSSARQQELFSATVPRDCEPVTVSNEQPRLPEPEGQPRLHEQAAARQLIETLVAEGADTFFGICGGPSAPIFEAIRLNPSARLIQCRHETNAAFACSTFHRATGKTAVLTVSGGPGITNCVDGVASANAEQDAMIVLAGDVAWAGSGKVLAQASGPDGFDAEGTLRPHTRRQIRVAAATSVQGCVIAALHAAQDPFRPGPSLLILPIDVGTEPACTLKVARPAAGAPTLQNPLPTKVLQEVAHALLLAKRPLLILGTKCRKCPAALETLLKVAQKPFVTTVMAKGTVKEDQEWCLHNCGLGNKPFIERYSRPRATISHPQLQIDVVIAIGTALDDSAISSLDLSEAKIYHVYPDAAVFGRNHRTTAGFASDAGAFCKQFAAALKEERAKIVKEDTITFSDLCNAETSTKSAYKDAMESGPLYKVGSVTYSTEEPIMSCRAIYELQQAMPDNTRFISDIGGHTFVATSYLTVKKPNTFFLSLDLGSMGSGIGGAVGLAVADSSTPVVLIVGDGGMQMYGMEVLVAVKYQLSIVFAVMNDARYNIVHHGMKAAFGQADAYDCPPVDFVAWAKALGVTTAARVVKGGEISAGLMKSLREEQPVGPIVLDILVDPAFYVSSDRVSSLTEMFAGNPQNTS